ncbi:hypothetical protein BV898_11107 [Hypsibius exemplaris]|uniref:Uncharacterized protein n=1 Tax=Hypsibius exemplaris TaxID=2072580 RepID=A0A1W0WHQ8_HYPEX|nr:hypothetical protein BV898_11107 [Hypsibius exemplaris]
MLGLCLTATNATVCDGGLETGCGCWKGWCYAYMTIPAKNDAPWCYTQRLGVSEPHADWASCTFKDHTQCSQLMTCGDSKRYRGNDILIPNDENVCDGSAARGCGCYKGWCYKNIELPAKENDLWCYTQKLGTAENKGNWAGCTFNDHSQCNRQMTCGESRRFRGEDTAGKRLADSLGK